MEETKERRGRERAHRTGFLRGSANSPREGNFFR